MKVITTFEDGKNVRVERFDDGLKIGERQVFMADYILSLMEELPINDIVAGMLERETELQEYFEYLTNQEENFSEFLVVAMEHAERYWLIDNPHYLSFVRYALEKVNVMEMEPRSIEGLFNSLLRHVKELPEEAVYIELLDTLLNRVVKDQAKTDCIEKISPIIITMAREMENPLLKEWFDIMVPHIEANWLLDAFRAKSTEKPLQLMATQIPKNCVFIQSTTAAINYVIEIPKSRIRVKFHDVAYEDVGHPRLLAIVSVADKRCTELKLFAVEDKGDINANTPLYSYPYSNVFENGRVCWSGYREVTIANTKDIDMLPLMFLSTVNNTHLRGNIRELYQEFSHKDFPNKNLAFTKYKLQDVL